MAPQRRPLTPPSNQSRKRTTGRPPSGPGKSERGVLDRYRNGMTRDVLGLNEHLEKRHQTKQDGI